MRIFLYWFVLAILSNTLHADLLIRSEMTQEGASGGVFKTVQMAKAGKFRIDAEPPIEVMGKTTTINDQSKELVCRINHRDKTYQMLRASDIEKEIAFHAKRMISNNRLPQERPVLRGTGKRSKIGEYEVEQYTADAGSGGTLTYWFAPSLVKFVPLLAASADPVGGALGLLFPDPASFPGIPIQAIVEQDFGGRRIISTITVTSIEEKVIPDSEFELPVGYTKTDLPTYP